MSERTLKFNQVTEARLREAIFNNSCLFKEKLFILKIKMDFKT
jgi:hypothetical protein